MARKIVLAAQPLHPVATALLQEQVEFRVASSPDPKVVAREIAGVHGLTFPHLECYRGLYSSLK